MVSVGKECRRTLFSAQYVKMDSHVVCVVTIQEADLAEDLMVDGETYGCVEFLLYVRHSRWRWWSGSCCYS